MPDVQERPLAPAVDRLSSDDDDVALQLKNRRRRNCLKCGGCCMAVTLLLAVTIIVLIFTVFRVKDPIIRLNGVNIDGLNLASGMNLRPGINLTLIADVSVKNPNAASFRFSNTTTTLYYWGKEVGEARNPPGSARARRTMRMNITIEIMPDRLISNPRLMSDINSQLLTMSSYTRMGGRVKMLKIINRHVIVRMNCTFTANISSRAIQDQKCRRRVKL